MTFPARAGIITLFLLAGSPGAAQGTGGVFGPVVNDGHRSLQYRLAYEFDSHLLAHRFDYQRALNGDLMLRGIVQTRETAASGADPDFFQGELFWQLPDVSRRWQHGLRFDVRIRTEGRPATLGVHWTNQFEFGSGWRARFVVLTTTDVGDGARSGVALQTRAGLSRAAGERLRLGIEMYSAYGAIDAVPSLDAQRHQVGPTLEARLGKDWRVYSGVLFGVTNATASAEARLRLGRTF